MVTRWIRKLNSKTKFSNEFVNSYTFYDKIRVGYSYLALIGKYLSHVVLKGVALVVKMLLIANLMKSNKALIIVSQKQ